MSKSLSKQEQNYSATEREALAVLTAIEHWRCYLDNGKKIVIYTNHSLKWFRNLNNSSGRLARCGVRLSGFDCEIRHRRGSDNEVPDSLSRIPISAINSSTSNSVILHTLILGTLTFLMVVKIYLHLFWTIT